jgi:hypothetical protein
VVRPRRVTGRSAVETPLARGAVPELLPVRFPRPTQPLVERQSRLADLLTKPGLNRYLRASRPRPAIKAEENLDLLASLKIPQPKKIIEATSVPG